MLLMRTTSPFLQTAITANKNHHWYYKKMQFKMSQIVMTS